MPGRDRKKRRRDGRTETEGGDVGANTGRSLQMLDASGRARDMDSGEEIPGSPIDVATLMERRKRLEEDTQGVTEDEIMAQLGAPDGEGGRKFEDEDSKVSGPKTMPRQPVHDEFFSGPKGDRSLRLPINEREVELPEDQIDSLVPPQSDNPGKLRTGVTGVTARPSHFISAQDTMESPSADFDAQLEQRIQDFIQNGSNDAPLLNAIVSMVEAIDPGNSTRIRERLEEFQRSNRERNARSVIR